jgi:hypothetical protein
MPCAVTSAATNPGFGGTTSPTKHELIRFARLVCDNTGIPFGPNKIIRLVRRFLNQLPNGSGWAFFLYLANEVGMSEEQQAAAQLSPDIAHALAHFDPTPALAFRSILWEQQHKQLGK